jgi:hypothetical protein
MASGTIVHIILGLYVDGDGKDHDTELNAFINSGDCLQIAHLDLASWKLDKPGAEEQHGMELDATPIREQTEAGLRLRFRWNPRGHDVFDGHASVEFAYSDGVKRNYSIEKIRFTRDQEWYIFPLV